MFRNFLAVLVAAAATAYGSSATSATITLSGASSNSCTYTSITPGAGAGDLVVTCGTSNGNTCVLDGSPNPVAAGGTITFTKSASCPANAVVSFQQNGTNDLGATYSVAPNASGSLTFYLVNGGVQVAATTVTISGGSSGTAPSCAEIVGPSSLNANANGSYSISCSNATSYNWSSATLAIAGSNAGATVSANAPSGAGLSTLQVNVCGTPSTNCTTKSISVSVIANSGGTGCSAVAGLQTNPGSVDGQTLWNSPGSYDSANINTGVASYPFTTSNFSTRLFKIEPNTTPAGYEYKDMSISRCPGDFSAAVPDFCKKNGRPSLTTIYVSNVDNGYSCVLQPGTQYYVNVKASTPGKAIGFYLFMN
jgi:hypothetical protein